MVSHGIEAVELVEDDMVGAEPLQVLVDLIDEMMPRGAGVVRCGADGVYGLGDDD